MKEIKQPKRKQALIDEKENALISKKLVTLKKDVPVSNYSFNLFKGIDKKKSLKFFEKHGFKNLIVRFSESKKKEDNQKRKYD